MKTTYQKVGDYYIPNLKVTQKKAYNLGKYSMMRLEFLKENKKADYQILMMKNTLADHLEEIEKSAQMRLTTIMSELKKQYNITEELKMNNQMKWVGLMNNIKHSAEEIILKELIYS